MNRQSVWLSIFYCQARNEVGITIVRPDMQQPGMATISSKTGEPVPSANTNLKNYPIDVFKEAMELTQGLKFKRMGNVKITADLFKQGEEEKAA